MPEFTAGQALTADQLNGILPLCAFKDADESVTSSTTLQNDDDLFVSVVANRTYIVEAVLNFSGDTGADAKWAFTFPAGCRWDLHFIGYDAALAIISAGTINQTSGTSTTVGVGGTGTYRPTHIRGTLQVGATAGTFQLQWAQFVSSATATVLREGSHLILHRVPTA